MSRQLTRRVLQNEAFFPLSLEIPEPTGDAGNHGSKSTANHLLQGGQQFDVANADASGYDVEGSRSTETVQEIVNRLRVLMAGVDTLQVLRN